jgi:hypothetical protein
MDRPLRVVLVRDRRPEERHDPIPEELIHRPLVAVDLRQHQLEGPVHHPVHVFRVEAFGEGGEPRHIHEEHGDLLALAFESTAGLQDLVGEVFRSVGRGWLGGRNEG